MCFQNCPLSPKLKNSTQPWPKVIFRLRCGCPNVAGHPCVSPNWAKCTIFPWPGRIFSCSGSGWPRFSWGARCWGGKLGAILCPPLPAWCPGGWLGGLGRSGYLGPGGASGPTNVSIGVEISGLKWGWCEPELIPPLGAPHSHKEPSKTTWWSSK